MSGAGRLEREATVFARYLAGSHPSSYVAGKYLTLSAVSPFRTDRFDRFDRALLAVGTWHPFFTRLADLHARFFRPTTRLRRKLILMTAILEASPGSAAALQASGGGLVVTLGLLAWIGLTSAVCLGLGLVIFVPTRFVAALLPAAPSA